MGYDGPRDLRHCIWYGGFGFHARWARHDVQEVARAIKALALFFRGAVVSDADLNNHPAFQVVTLVQAGAGGHAAVIRDALDARLGSRTDGRDAGDRLSADPAQRA